MLLILQIVARVFFLAAILGGLGGGRLGWLLLLLLGDFLLADAVLLDQLVKGVEVAEDVDAAASVQVGRLEQPQVEGVKVAERHGELLVSPLLEVECLKFSDLARVGDRLTRLRACDTLQSLDFVLKRRVLLGSIRSGRVHCLFLLKLYLVMQLPNQLLVKLLQLILVGFEGLPEGDKWRQGLVDQLVARGIRDLDEEGYRHDIESVLLVQVAEALHDHQQVVLLSQ